VFQPIQTPLWKLLIPSVSCLSLTFISGTTERCICSGAIWTVWPPWPLHSAAEGPRADAGSGWWRAESRVSEPAGRVEASDGPLHQHEGENDETACRCREETSTGERQRESWATYLGCIFRTLLLRLFQFNNMVVLNHLLALKL